MTLPPSDDVVTPIDHASRTPSTGSLRMPATIEPMLATEAREPFDSNEHIFELMWGGIRTIAYVREGTVRLQARNGRDLTPYFPELLCIPDRVNAREAILDGEIIAVDSEGQPSFDMLRPRLQTMAAAIGPDREQLAELPVQFKLKRVSGQICFQASDILWLDGRSLIDRPLWQRKNRLHDIITSGAEFAAVDFVDDEGTAFFDAVLQRRLDGIVARAKTSVYTPGRRSKSWLNIRALHSGDFVVGGYTIGGARRKGEPFSQLLLGAYVDGRLDYVGAVSGGLTDAEARQLIESLEPLHETLPPFHDAPNTARLTFWTRPEVVCHVRYSEWSPDGYLRFPIFSALRPDLAPEQCMLE